MNVAQVLKHKGADVETISASAGLNDAIRILGSRNIGALVVLDSDEQIAGIISERDIIRTLTATNGLVCGSKIWVVSQFEFPPQVLI